VPLVAQRSFPREVRLSRIVAEDYLVSSATNRYSVPVHLIGERVEVQRCGKTVHIFYRNQEIATHSMLSGTHQFRILLEHSPGAIARTTRQRRSTVSGASAVTRMLPEVEICDLACYKAVCDTPVIQLTAGPTQGG